MFPDEYYRIEWPFGPTVHGHGKVGCARVKIHCCVLLSSCGFRQRSEVFAANHAPRTQRLVLEQCCNRTRYLARENLEQNLHQESATALYAECDQHEQFLLASATQSIFVQAILGQSKKSPHALWHRLFGQYSPLERVL